MSLWIKLLILITVVTQSGSSEMVKICQIAYISMNVHPRTQQYDI